MALFPTSHRLSLLDALTSPDEFPLLDLTFARVLPEARLGVSKLVAGHDMACS
jgi:hypothetical protein